MCAWTTGTKSLGAEVSTLPDLDLMPPRSPIAGAVRTRPRASPVLRLSDARAALTRSANHARAISRPGGDTGGLDQRHPFTDFCRHKTAERFRTALIRRRDVGTDLCKPLPLAIMGSAIAFCTAALIRSTMACGVPFGMNNAVHDLRSAVPASRLRSPTAHWVLRLPGLGW